MFDSLPPGHVNPLHAISLTLLLSQILCLQDDGPISFRDLICVESATDIFDRIQIDLESLAWLLFELIIL